MCVASERIVAFKFLGRFCVGCIDVTITLGTVSTQRLFWYVIKEVTCAFDGRIKNQLCSLLLDFWLTQLYCGDVGSCGLNHQVIDNWKVLISH